MSRIVYIIFLLYVSAVSAYSQNIDVQFAEYDLMQKRIMTEHELFSRNVAAKWGDTTIIESGKKRWVEYNDQLNSRSIVDFETGDVKIEVLLSEDDNESTIESKLKEAMSAALTSKGHTSFDSKKQVSSTPIIGSQVDLANCGIDLGILFPSANSKPITPPMPKVSSQATLSQRKEREYKDTQTMIQKKLQAQIIEEEPQIVAESIVENVGYETKEVVDDIGAKKIVATIDLRLVEGHISERASRYKDTISKFSKHFTVSEPVIYAIMEQESAFNPMAESWVPAYGLMQIVPKSGGLDAYRYVYQKDRIVSSDYLFDPSNNIELGTALIKLLDTRYLAEIKDARCRLLCVIASYNCGAGGVSRAITGDTNLSRAIPIINRMNYNELYNHLRANLPDETRNYIYKVTNNLDKYSNN